MTKKLEIIAVALAFLMGAELGVLIGFVLNMYTSGVLWIVITSMSTAICALLFLAVSWLDDARRLRKGGSSMPLFADKETPITVQELRKLAYSHGKAVSVLVTWNNGNWQLVTAGATAGDADVAVCIRDEIAKLLQLNNVITLEDRRHEHRR